MDENAHEQFDVLRLGLGGIDFASEAPLVLAEGALDLPSLAVALGGEGFIHLASPRSSWRAVAPAQRRYYAVGAEAVADECVVGFGVVSGVGQHLVEWERAVGDGERPGEFDVVGQWPAVGDGGGEEVARRVAHDGELGVVGFLDSGAFGEVL